MHDYDAVNSHPRCVMNYEIKRPEVLKTRAVVFYAAEPSTAGTQMNIANKAFGNVAKSLKIVFETTPKADSPVNRWIPIKLI